MPTNAQRSTTLDRRASIRATKTPVRRFVSVEPTAAATVSLPVPSTARRASKRKSSFLDAVTEGADQTPSKKRRLVDATAAPSVPSIRGSPQANVPHRSEPRRQAFRKSDFIAIAEEPSDEDKQAPPEEPNVEPDQTPNEGLGDLQADKENDEPSSNTTKPKRKKRKSIAQRPKKRSSTGSLQNQLLGPSRRSASEISGRREEERQQSSVLTAAGRQDFTQAPRDSKSGQPVRVRHEDGVAIPTKAPRAAAKSQEPNIVNELPRRKKTAIAPQSSPAPAEDENDGGTDSILSVQKKNATMKGLKHKSFVVRRAGGRVSVQSTAFANPIPRSRRAPAHSASPAATPYREADENEDETYVPEEFSPDLPTPAVTKKPRKNARIIPSIENDESIRRSTSSQPKQTDFPITIHRLSNLSALPTITEENEQDPDFDELQAHFGASRSAPNAVDVLAQICRETVASALASTRTNMNGSGLKRRTEALESFGKEIDTRLFDMSAAVENRLTLEARVRTSKRDKGEIQARWIEVRRKREEIALKMDKVRREHWESEEQGAEALKLSEGLHGVEIAMERQKGTETESLEYLLMTVGASVSGQHGGGVLQRVKSFNAQMERMIDVLER